MVEFGIEYETCIVIDNINSINNNTHSYNNDSINFNNYNEKWIEYMMQYLLKISDNLLTTKDKDILSWCNNFKNIITVGKLQENSNSKIYKYYEYNIINYTLTPISISTFNYQTPLIVPDLSIVCHDYIHGFKNVSEHPSLHSELSVYPSNYKINLLAEFTVNVELVTPILQNFNEYYSFKKLMLPKSVKTLYNKSQGIHLNVNITNVNINTIKGILHKYYKWEKQHSTVIRPHISKYAQILYDKNINNIQYSSSIYNLNSVLHKMKSVHIKLLDKVTLLEFRIFSQYSNNIDNYINHILSLVSSKIDKKLKRGGTYKNKYATFRLRNLTKRNEKS